MWYLYLVYSNAIATKYSCKKKGRFYCILKDFSKAFDTIRHDILLDSLKHAGITGKFLTILGSMFSKLSACVRKPNGLSQFFSCNVGTRQGCILSPQLFIIFIEHLHNTLKEFGGRGVMLNDVNNLFALMFADDVSGLAGRCNQLQLKINALEIFCAKVNLKKTKIVVFSQGGQLRSYEKWYYIKVNQLKQFHHINI